jgi:hypothetical protein
MGLQSFGWVDGPWRTAPSGRPRRRGPPGRPPGRLPAGRQPPRPADGATVRHPTDGRSGRLAVGWPSAMPFAGWGGGRHAVRRTSVGLSDASGRLADADVDVQTRDNPASNDAISKLPKSPVVLHHFGYEWSIGERVLKLFDEVRHSQVVVGVRRSH